MSQGPNPYASPQFTGAGIPQAGPQGALFGMWRQGDYLVFDKRVRLPDVCLISNEPARERSNLTYQYMPVSARVMAGLFGWLIAQAFCVNATIDMPVSDSVIAQRWQAFFYGVGGTVLGILMFIGGIALIEPVPALGLILVFGGLAVLIVGLIAAAWMYKNVQTYFINETHIWFSGVHADYLARLPHWPYEPV